MKNFVKSERLQLNLTQEDLAQALQVSRQTINAIETGRYLPSLPLAIQISQFFSKKVEDIFILSSDPDQES